MRMSLVAFLFCLISPIANAEYFRLTKPVICGELETLAKQIAENYQEKIYWIGQHREAQSNYALLINAKTQSWTILQAQGTVACIIGTGNGNQLLLGQQLPD